MQSKYKQQVETVNCSDMKAIHMPETKAIMQPAYLVSHVHICPNRQELLHDSNMPVFACQVQRVQALAVYGLQPLKLVLSALRILRSLQLTSTGYAFWVTVGRRHCDGQTLAQVSPGVSLAH